MSTLTPEATRYIVINTSESAHCCFVASVIDTYQGKESYGNYWKKVVCETFEIEDAEQIANALNTVY